MTSLTDTWQPLLNKLKIFSELVDKIAEVVHPYAKMAWSVLSACHKTIVAQGDRDDRIQRLYKIMDDVYTNVIEAESSRIESHTQLIAVMSRQTIECGYFITSYAKNKNFWMRLVKNAISSADTAIDGFQSKFDDLKKQFHEEAIRSTEITVMHTEILVANILDEVKNLVDLRDLPYANDARFRSDKQCLAGTREEILDEIANWINNTDNLQNIFLLCGAAGTGKSAIAHTIAKRFELLGHLGSSYCFRRSNQANRHPGNLFSTVAVDLAYHSTQIKNALHAVIQSNRSLRTTQDVATQFENFILKPVKDITAAGPIVIVIDALDESGDYQSRSEMLAVLAKEMTGLPPHFRVLLTSRLEDDIHNFFNGNDSVKLKHMNSISVISTDQDIFAYIQFQLSNFNGRHLAEFDEVKCRLLTIQSEHLFQWAYVACGFIKGVDGKAGSVPIKRYSLLMDNTLLPHKGLKPLYKLYLDILTQLFDSDDQAVMKHFTSVMGKIITAVEPLSIDSLCAMQTAADSSIFKSDIISIVQFMGSLLSGVMEVDHFKYIQPLHTSFSDFLTNKSQSGDFHVDVSEQHLNMAQACLNVMREELKFNICKLKTSYKLNKDVCNLNELVLQNISQQLSYSCKFWIYHFYQESFDSNLQMNIKIFLYEKLLYWLEVLSVLNKSDQAPKILSLFLKLNMNNDMKNFVKDAIQFVSVFGNVIAQSVPHIYLSALPFAPKTSLLAQHYLPQISQTLMIESGKVYDWPVLQHILEGHNDIITSVAFSPDSKYIASGSLDKTIRVWDTETGMVICGPLKGHTHHIISLAFSSSGKHIVSGSNDKTIRVWETDTGAVTLGPL
ncbi:hypothetical protein BD410DRAFT_871159, partial [Rickenella mellea]